MSFLGGGEKQTVSQLKSLEKKIEELQKGILELESLIRHNYRALTQNLARNFKKTRDMIERPEPEKENSLEPKLDDNIILPQQNKKKVKYLWERSKIK